MKKVPFLVFTMMTILHVAIFCFGILFVKSCGGDSQIKPEEVLIQTIPIAPVLDTTSSQEESLESEKNAQVNENLEVTGGESVQESEEKGEKYLEIQTYLRRLTDRDNERHLFVAEAPELATKFLEEDLDFDYFKNILDYLYRQK